jgi:hypothetical protein
MKVLSDVEKVLNLIVDWKPEKEPEGPEKVKGLYLVPENPPFIN